MVQDTRSHRTEASGSGITTSAKVAPPTHPARAHTPTHTRRSLPPCLWLASTHGSCPAIVFIRPPPPQHTCHHLPPHAPRTGDKPGSVKNFTDKNFPQVGDDYPQYADMFKAELCVVEALPAAPLPLLPCMKNGVAEWVSAHPWFATRCLLPFMKGTMRLTGCLPSRARGHSTSSPLPSTTTASACGTSVPYATMPASPRRRHALDPVCGGMAAALDAPPLGRLGRLLPAVPWRPRVAILRALTWRDLAHKTTA